MRLTAFGATLAAILLSLTLTACSTPDVSTGSTDDGSMGALAAKARGGDVMALQSIQTMAEQGSLQAQFNLGVGYAEGWTGTVDMDQAIRIWRQAAAQGSADSRNALGIASARGLGVPRDESQAMALWSEAAQQGNASAAYNLGAHLLVDAQTPTQAAQAAQWIQVSAQHGDVDAIAFLANLYAHGEGVVRDDSEAVRLWRVAGDKGQADAQYSLGQAYARGRGVPLDSNEAKRWFQAAAKQGHPDAQLALAGTLLNGDTGAGQETAEAQRLLQMAAGNRETEMEAAEDRLAHLAALRATDRASTPRWTAKDESIQGRSRSDVAVQNDTPKKVVTKTQRSVAKAKPSRSIASRGKSAGGGKSVSRGKPVQVATASKSGRTAARADNRVKLAMVSPRTKVAAAAVPVERESVKSASLKGSTQFRPKSSAAPRKR